MTRSGHDEIDRLLQEGLNHYGTGDVDRAADCWRRVLELDPGHAEAQEYLQTALDDAPASTLEEEAPASVETPSQSSEDRAQGVESLLEEAQHLLQADDPESALELLETIAAQAPDRLEIHGYIEMVRSRLLKQYRERLAAGGAVPRQRLAPDQVMKYNLPPDVGFLLSLVDGVTPVKDLISVCGMDEFRSLRILSQLVNAGIVEI